jgi:repressor LexA
MSSSKSIRPDGRPISKKQKEILDFIEKEILERGFPPSVREICEAVHLKSTSSVHAHLESLEKNGYIRKDPTKPRAIEVLDEDFRNKRLAALATAPSSAGTSSQPEDDHDAADSLRVECQDVPVIGDVAAGQPLLAIEHTEMTWPIPVSKLPNGQTFLLRVKGESMINAGILDGDMVLVKQGNTAYNGDMVVALIDDSATVKTFYKENGYIRLQPQNDNMDPIIVRPDQHFEILGQVIGVLRFFL